MCVRRIECQRIGGTRCGGADAQDRADGRRRKAFEGLPLIALDPTPAAVARVAGKYRYKVLIKVGGTALSRRLVGEVLARFTVDPNNRDVSVYADRNPVTVL